MSKLKEGQEVTINIPFTYTIGEEGPITGKILETIEDCENEVREEIDAGMSGCDLMLEVQKGTSFVVCHKCGEKTLDHPEIGICQHCLTAL